MGMDLVKEISSQQLTNANTINLTQTEYVQIVK